MKPEVQKPSDPGPPPSYVAEILGSVEGWLAMHAVPTGQRVCLSSAPDRERGRDTTRIVWFGWEKCGRRPRLAIIEERYDCLAGPCRDGRALHSETGKPVKPIRRTVTPWGNVDPWCQRAAWGKVWELRRQIELYLRGIARIYGVLAKRLIKLETEMRAVERVEQAAGHDGWLRAGQGQFVKMPVTRRRRSRK